MSSDRTSSDRVRARDAALQDLAASAVANIPGVDMASVTLRRGDDTLTTLAATDPLAEQLDALQYDLREGPCFAAVTVDRLVLVSDVARSTDFPRFGPRAAELGVQAQAAVQLISDGESAGLNLYALQQAAFDSSTIQWAELFATQAAAVPEYADQVEQLSEALHTRTDIGTAVGIVMERFGLDRNPTLELPAVTRERSVMDRLKAPPAPQ